MSKPRLIVVDDEPAMADLVCEVAQQAGYECEKFHHAENFIDEFSHDSDVILLDLMMPGLDGVEVIRYLAEQKCGAHIALISGFDPSVLHSAQKLAIDRGLNFSGSLQKPFRYMELYKFLHGLSVINKKAAPDESKKQTVITIDDLISAIQTDEFIVHYQPKVDLSNGELSGLEALVRWQHPSQGMVPPDAFISMAERNGLIDDLTWIVLNRVCEFCNTWLGQGVKVKVAVNMSASTLRELSLPERMEQLVNHYQIEPSQIVLEVTETALMQELVNSLDILTRLRIKGFSLSIDDFGTGYSSLIQLHRAPFSEIKIDKSFVIDMEQDKEAAAIVETVIVLGHKLNMSVVAEGVETEFAQAQLKALGCDVLQGYFVSAPLAEHNIERWLSLLKASKL